MNAKRILVALVGLTLATACGEPAPAASTTTDAGATDATAVADTAAKDTAARVQFYSARFEFHGGPFDGRVFEVDRDLTQIDSVLIYGNTHLTPPAVAFGLEDTIPQPATSANGKPTIINLAFQLRFGILIEAPGFPVNTGQAGNYKFGCKAPLVHIKLDTWNYRTTCPTANGSLDVDKWSASPGGKFSGSLKGRAPMFFFDSSHTDPCKAESAAVTCKVTDKWVDFEASYDFVVPELNKNSAPDTTP